LPRLSTIEYRPDQPIHVFAGADGDGEQAAVVAEGDAVAWVGEGLLTACAAVAERALAE
jgi:hypothetical protein